MAAQIRACSKTRSHIPQGGNILAPEGGRTMDSQGDSNSEFFHRYANGRKQKSTIISLESDQGEVKGQENIVTHIVSFYKNLFGPNPPRNLHLSTDF